MRRRSSSDFEKTWKHKLKTCQQRDPNSSRAPVFNGMICKSCDSEQPLPQPELLRVRARFFGVLGLEAS